MTLERGIPRSSLRYRSHFHYEEKHKFILTPPTITKPDLNGNNHRRLRMLIVCFWILFYDYSLERAYRSFGSFITEADGNKSHVRSEYVSCNYVE